MYRLEVRPLVKKDVGRLPAHEKERALRFMETLQKEPRPAGCKKLYGPEHRWRVRFGKYRILYEIDEERQLIIVFRVLHRKDAYR